MIRGEFWKVVSSIFFSITEFFLVAEEVFFVHPIPLGPYWHCCGQQFVKIGYGLSTHLLLPCK